MYRLYCILSAVSIIMINQKQNKGKQNIGSFLLLPAYGRVGQGQHSLAAHFAKRNTKNCGGEKRSGESEGGQKFFPPNPLPFCPPERLDFKIRNSDFCQKMFEHQSENTAKLYFQRNHKKLPRRKAPRHGIFPQF